MFVAVMLMLMKIKIWMMTWRMRMRMMGECIPFTLYISLDPATMLAELLGEDGTEPGQEGKP